MLLVGCCLATGGLLLLLSCVVVVCCCCARLILKIPLVHILHGHRRMARWHFMVDSHGRMSTKSQGRLVDSHGWMLLVGCCLGCPMLLVGCCLVVVVVVV